MDTRARPLRLAHSFYRKNKKRATRMEDYLLAVVITMTAVISTASSSAVSMKVRQNGQQCVYQGKIYPVNSSFVTSDCSMQCYCLRNGMTSCMDLCSPLPQGKCPVGTKPRDEREPAGPRGSKCFCMKRYCEPEYCFTKSFAKYKIGESFKRGCTDICTCTPKGKFKCTPVCPTKQCPAGYKLKLRKKKIMVDGCSCPKSRCVLKKRRTCKYNGRTYSTKRYFEANNCQSKCRCKRNGVVKCWPLCPTIKPPRCNVNEKLVEISVQPSYVAKGRCQCLRPICVPYTDVANRPKQSKRPRTCKMGNMILSPGQLHITSDCSDRCRCSTLGHVVCVPLCMSPPVTCLPDEERVLVKTPVKGSKCMCTRTQCRPKKTLGKRESECNVDGHRFSTDIEYVDKHCTKRCSCSTTGRPVCRPLCPAISSAFCHHGYPSYRKVRVNNESWCSCVIKTCNTYYGNQSVDISEN